MSQVFLLCAAGTHSLTPSPLHHSLPPLTPAMLSEAPKPMEPAAVAVRIRLPGATLLSAPGDQSCSPPHAAGCKA